MPPVRTIKQNSSTAKSGILSAPGFVGKPDKDEAVASSTVKLESPAPSVTEPSKKNPSRPVVQGVKDARFDSSKRDWDEKYYQLIGTSTRKIFFGIEFKLTDNHINDILSLGNRVCEKLWAFIFEYVDVDHDSNNDAMSLTDEAVVRLARACPNLRTVRIPGTYHLADDSLLAFFEFCPKLTLVELTRNVHNFVGQAKVSGRSLEKLRENPEWGPKLKKLSVPDGDAQFLKTVRALTKEREWMTVTVVHSSYGKKWGSEYINNMSEDYRKGRKQFKF
ncbi:MAG: hypothetical protein M1820_008517 [Bogoriella megaspora]|nr:MAG: hypothetical protein M1820_008517 [Bogoriella megaspora]